MSRADLVIEGERVVTAEGTGPAAVVVREGRIAAILPHGEAPPSARRVEAGGAVVMPGLLDVHVHVNEPGRTEWEGFETAGAAAAAGGVTTLVDMPLNSLPPTTDREALEQKAAAAAGVCRIDFGLWGGLVPGNGEEIGRLLDAGALGLKAFLVDSGVAEFPPVGEGTLREALPHLAERDVPLLVHAELSGPIEAAARRRRAETPGAAARRNVSGADPRRHATWLASRPPEAEVEAVELLVRLAAESGARIHVVHVSAADALVPIDRARAEGLRVTCETCPHYLSFAAEEVPDGATEFKCAPPIREVENRERLWEALAEGRIDLVASDHSPCPPERKHREAGDFDRAWGGIASLELLLAATWTEACPRGHPPGRLARWLSEAPAALAGLAGRKGRIAPGFDADLLVWDPEAEFTVDPARLRQRHPVTPYAGRRLRGRVLQAFVRGAAVVEDGELTGSRPGRWLRRPDGAGPGGGAEVGRARTAPARRGSPGG